MTKILEVLFDNLMTFIYFIKSPDKIKRLRLYLKYGSKEIFLRDIYRSVNKYELSLDVGSYNGDSSIYLNEFVSSEVIAFEPSKKINNIKFKYNKYNIKTIKLPVLDGSLVSLIGDNLTCKTIKGGTIKSIKLSNYIKKNCFLKIDCEGSEYIIFKDLIKTNKIKFIKEFVCEFHIYENSELGEILQYLEKYYYLHYRGDMCPLSRIKTRQDLLIHGFLK